MIRVNEESINMCPSGAIYLALVLNLDLSSLPESLISQSENICRCGPVYHPLENQKFLDLN